MNGDYDDLYEGPYDDDGCPMCGGDGLVPLSECGPSEWGEDCFMEEDRFVECPECAEREDIWYWGQFNQGEWSGMVEACK